MEAAPVHLNRYEILRPLAEGGFGQVYLARILGEAGFYRTVAIKRIRPELTAAPEFVHDFIKEARIGGYLQHHNVVQVLGFEKLGGHYALIMDYVDGVGLERVIGRMRGRGEELPLSVIAEIAAQSADGLQYVHDLRGPEGEPLGLVHRDLKPSNLLISGSGLVKISDFGIARAAVQLGQQRTQAGMLKGTMAYFSPEQARGEGIDHRSDLYSLGAIIYEMLALKGLFPEKDPFAVLGKVGRNDIQGKLEELPARAAPFRALLDEVLTTEPSQRIQTAAALATRIRQVMRTLDDHGETLQEHARAWCASVRKEDEASPTSGSANTDPWLPRDGAPTQIAYHAAATEVVGEQTARYEAPPTGIAQLAPADDYERRQTAVNAGRGDDVVPTAMLGPHTMVRALNDKAAEEAGEVGPAPSSGQTLAGSGAPAVADEPEPPIVVGRAPGSRAVLIAAALLVAAVVGVVLMMGRKDAPAVAPVAQAPAPRVEVKPAPPPVEAPAEPEAPAQPEASGEPAPDDERPATNVFHEPPGPQWRAPAKDQVKTQPAPRPAAPRVEPAPVVKADPPKDPPAAAEPSAPAVQPPAPVEERPVAKLPAAPAADPGKLLVSSLPSSRVFVNGEDYGETPVSKKSLAPGKYSLRLSRPDLGFSKTVEVEVKAGKTARVICSADGCDVTYP